MVHVESRRATAPPVVLTATLGLAAACWAAAVWLMRDMNMGVATPRGSFGFFAAAWLTMMAAMMLPGAAPAIARHARVRDEMQAAPLFAGSYLAIWAIAGIAAYALVRPHATVAAGAVVIAAGSYELTPLKRHFRRRCRDSTSSGFWFGLCCLGSTIGLMAMLLAIGVMSIAWMAVITVLGLAQKLLPPRAAIDVPLALAIIGLGIVIVIAPTQIPGLIPPMM